MSLFPETPAPLHWRATPRLYYSVWLAALLCLAGVLAGRPAVVALAMPFVAHALRAALMRPNRRPGQWRVSQSANEVTEGSATHIEVGVDDGPPALVTLAWTPQPLQLTTPAEGVSTGASAGVSIEPRRWGMMTPGPGIAAAQDLSGAWVADEKVGPLRVRVRPAASTMVGGSGVRSPLGINGAHLSGIRGEGTEIAEVRQYRAGDRLRRITWRVSSRTEELHVVESLTERETDVLIVLDTQQPASELGTEPDSSLDIGIRVAIALATHYVGFGDRVGVHDLGRRVGDLPLRSGTHQLRVLTEMLARTQREESTNHPPLRPTRPPRPGTLVFVCSPLLDEEVLTEIGRLRGFGVELVVIDTMPTVLGSAGLAQVPENQLDLAQAWAIRRLQRDQVVDELRRHGVPVTTWQGPASLAAVLYTMERAGHAPRMVKR